MNLEFSRQIFKKSPNIKSNENSSNGSRVVPCGRMDGQTNRQGESNSRYSQIFAIAPKNKKNPRSSLEL